jgi:hypothetical protein
MKHLKKINEFFHQDYFSEIVIGSNGFGGINNTTKQIIEKEYLIEYLMKNYPIPKEFENICFYKAQENHHEMGIYIDIVLKYNTYELDEIEIDDEDKYFRFWDFVTEIESVDLESDEMTEAMEKIYKNQK